MFRYLNWEEDCIFLNCRRKSKKERKKNNEISPKVELRPSDYTSLGLTPGKEFCCPKHFTHSRCHLANQLDFVIENGFLAEGAFLKKSYSHSGLKKSVLERASQFATDLLIGSEVEVSVVSKTSVVGWMEPLHFHLTSSRESQKSTGNNTTSCFIPLFLSNQIKEHDYCFAGIEQGTFFNFKFEFLSFHLHYIFEAFQ